MNQSQQKEIKDGKSLKMALPVSEHKRGMKSVCSEEAFRVSSLFVGTHVENTSIVFNFMYCFFVLNNLLQSSLISRLYGFNMHVSAKNSNEHNNHSLSGALRCTLHSPFVMQSFIPSDAIWRGNTRNASEAWRKCFVFNY